MQVPSQNNLPDTRSAAVMTSRTVNATISLFFWLPQNNIWNPHNRMAIIFSRLMDAGKKLIAKIKNIEKKGSFNQISIGIYLVDF